jgi:hypothetical protein
MYIAMRLAITDKATPPIEEKLRTNQGDQFCMGEKKPHFRVRIPLCIRVLKHLPALCATRFALSIAKLPQMIFNLLTQLIIFANMRTWNTQ